MSKSAASGFSQSSFFGINYNPKTSEIEVLVASGETVHEVVNDFDEVVNEVVRLRPGIRKPELLLHVKKSRATLERALARLIGVSRIEFRGAPKTGGYYVKNLNKKDSQ